MTLFAWLKSLHIACALLSISGFTLRGYWMISESPRLRLRSARVLPHVIDSLLLGSAIGMLFAWQVSPLQMSWLTAKICALLLYIGLGMVALRFGRSKPIRITAWLLALLTAAYIVSVAYSKNPWGFLPV